MEMFNTISILLISIFEVFLHCDCATFVSKHQRIKTIDELMSNYKYLGDLLSVFEYDREITKYKENLNDVKSNMNENCSKEVEEYESRLDEYENRVQHQEIIIQQIEKGMKQEYDESYNKVKEEYSAKLKHEADLKIEFQSKLNREYIDKVNILENECTKNKALLKDEIEARMVLREEYLKCKTQQMTSAMFSIDSLSEY